MTILASPFSAAAACKHGSSSRVSKKWLRWLTCMLKHEIDLIWSAIKIDWTSTNYIQT